MHSKSTCPIGHEMPYRTKSQSQALPSSKQRQMMPNATVSTKELAKIFAVKANRDKPATALNLIRKLTDTILEQIIAGKNVTLSRLGTFKIETQPLDDINWGPTSCKQPIATFTFVPYRAFRATAPRADIRLGDKREEKYRLIADLPEILDLIDEYCTYMNNLENANSKSFVTFFGYNRRDSAYRRRLKFITRVVLQRISDNSTQNRYIEAGFGWPDELEILCNVVYELLDDDSTSQKTPLARAAYDFETAKMIDL
ncbi:HU family DNA-binding protein [Desulfovibrio sp. OttesenSCG-928-C06]|nr:HU family DNA-binding protein [Desulfovibrio sp. OttesenSCG-928-C06]